MTFICENSRVSIKKFFFNFNEKLSVFKKPQWKYATNIKLNSFICKTSRNLVLFHKFVFLPFIMIASLLLHWLYDGHFKWITFVVFRGQKYLHSNNMQSILGEKISSIFPSIKSTTNDCLALYTHVCTRKRLGACLCEPLPALSQYNRRRLNEKKKYLLN